MAFVWIGKTSVTHNCSHYIGRRFRSWSLTLRKSPGNGLKESSEKLDKVKSCPLLEPQKICNLVDISNLDLLEYLSDFSLENYRENKFVLFWQETCGSFSEASQVALW